MLIDQPTRAPSLQLCVQLIKRYTSWRYREIEFDTITHRHCFDSLFAVSAYQNSARRLYKSN